jgi:hypothetical protein
VDGDRLIEESGFAFLARLTRMSGAKLRDSATGPSSKPEPLTRASKTTLILYDYARRIATK